MTSQRLASWVKAAVRRTHSAPFRPLVRFAAASLLVAGVSACASNPPPATSATDSSGSTMAIGVAGPLAGHWMVADVHPSGQVALTAPERRALVGRTLSLSDSRAEDASGRVCEAPSYSIQTLPLGDAMGARQIMPGSTERVSAISVTCATLPFARFLVLPKGVLLIEDHGSWLSLLPAPSAAPAMMMSAEPAPAPAPAPTPASPEKSVSKDAMEGKHATAAPTHGQQGMHLASYRGEGMAREGWAELKKSYPALASLSPSYVPVKINGKGSFVRLYAVGASAAEMEKTCATLHAAKQYCVIMSLGK